MHVRPEQISAAADKFTSLIRENPNALDAPWLQLAGCRILQGDFRAGLPAIGARLTLQPDDPVAMNDLSDAMTSLGDGQMAAKWAQRGTKVQPDYFPAWIGLGNGLMTAERPHEAIAAYTEALRSPIASTDPRLLCNAGLAMLSIGNLRGWALRETRFEGNPSLIPRRRWRDRPYWRGESLIGKTIVVWPEQGVGDEIVFASCFKDLTSWAPGGGHIIVQCDRRLVDLYRRSFPYPNIEFTSDPGPIWAPPSDFTVASGSLPAELRASLEMFPTETAYLTPDPALTRAWRKELFMVGSQWGDEKKLAVGICWRSILAGATRDRHYTTLRDLAPLLAVPGVRFVNLQHGLTGEECGDPLISRLHHFPEIDLKDDFEGTAALLSELDVVIGPGTTMTTLAAAVGTRTWMLAPRQDWMRLGTEHYPWLPKLMAFPSTGDGWADQIAAMAAGLAALVSVHTPS